MASAPVLLRITQNLYFFFWVCSHLVWNARASSFGLNETGKVNHDHGMQLMSSRTLCPSFKWLTYSCSNLLSEMDHSHLLYIPNFAGSLEVWGPHQWSIEVVAIVIDWWPKSSWMEMIAIWWVSRILFQDLRVSPIRKISCAFIHFGVSLDHINGLHHLD